MNFSDTDFLIILSTIVILLVILMMVSIYGIFIKKKSELLLAQQRKEALFEQELAMSQVEIKEQTLNYIGQELHDDLGQKLSVARLMTSKIRLSNSNEKEEITNEINQLIGECIQDIRNLSKVFITKQVEHFGFVDSLEREIFRIKKLELLDVEYCINNREFVINPDHALILFRIIQECINNVIKHSKSKSFKLIVEDSQDFLKFSINDRGIGFRKNAKIDGSGLRNIQNRAKLINADFKLKSVENIGTKVTIIYKK